MTTNEPAHTTDTAPQPGPQAAPQPAQASARLFEGALVEHVVTLPGATDVVLRLTPLPASRVREIDRLLPMPEPPKIPNPDVGSKHPDKMRPDPTDADFLRAIDRVERERQLGELALAMDWQYPVDGEYRGFAHCSDDAARTAWLKGAVADIEAGMTSTTLSHLEGELLYAQAIPTLDAAGKKSLRQRLGLETPLETAPRSSGSETPAPTPTGSDSPPSTD